MKNLSFCEGCGIMGAMGRGRSVFALAHLAGCQPGDFLWPGLIGASGGEVMNQRALKDRVKEAIPKDSIGRCDLLPIFADTALFSEMVKFFSTIYAGKVDYIASPEAIGWILGVSIARDLNVGFIPIRKGGKLPYPKTALISAEYLDYSRTLKVLALKKTTFPTGSRVLIVDEWIETGASVRCCIELLEKAGCIISGLATIGIDYNENTMSWVDAGFVTFIGQDI